MHHRKRLCVLGGRGFTLIEILIAIGILAALAAVAIVAINPARQFAQARNSQRQSNITTLLNAIGQNIADNKGVFTCGSVTLEANSASTSIDNGSGGSGKNLSCLSPTYIPVFPIDPNNPNAPASGYTVSVDSVGRVMVCAPNANEAALGSPGGLCVMR